MAKATKNTGVDQTARRAEVREPFDEATVDAHDESEQHSGLLSVIGDELAFPFRAKVLGELVNVVDMEWPELIKRKWKRWC